MNPVTHLIEIAACIPKEMPNFRMEKAFYGSNGFNMVFRDKKDKKRYHIQIKEIVE